MSGRARSALRRTRLRLPIRVKLAVVSAGLTFAILLLFAVVVGAVTDQRLMAGFDDDLRATAADLQDSLQVRPDEETGAPELAVDNAELLRAAAAGDAVIRVIDRSERVLGRFPRGTPPLGAPFEGVTDAGDYRVASRPLFAGSFDPINGFDLQPDPIDGTVAFVQYAKPRGAIEDTTDRLHLFLALGVIGGTALAFLAGFLVARRAMRPIADLTRAAREVARTRDPAKSLPHPEADDEVAELAATLEQMLRELDAARGETQAALERQREFVADASHELRTPLTSILANLELLEEDLGRSRGPSDREAAAEAAGSALRSSRRMRRLVGDLLLLARADAGRRSPRRPVDLAAVVRDAAVEVGPLAGGHPISLDLPAAAATVEGVPDDLHRLVLNLLENALLHTPAGTPVVASVRGSGEQVRLEVADRGPGVAPELRERVFERFAHSGSAHGGARSGAGNVHGGSGLGLAIVRAVVEAHGGTVTIDEAEGGGALLVVALPASAAGQAEGEQSSRADATAVPGDAAPQA